MLARNFFRFFGNITKNKEYIYIHIKREYKLNNDHTVTINESIFCSLNHGFYKVTMESRIEYA